MGYSLAGRRSECCECPKGLPLVHRSQLQVKKSIRLQFQAQTCRQKMTPRHTKKEPSQNSSAVSQRPAVSTSRQESAETSQKIYLVRTPCQDGHKQLATTPGARLRTQWCSACEQTDPCNTCRVTCLLIGGQPCSTMNPTLLIYCWSIPRGLPKCYLQVSASWMRGLPTESHGCHASRMKG